VNANLEAKKKAAETLTPGSKEKTAADLDILVLQ
jgi:hypothetical protein